MQKAFPCEYASKSMWCVIKDFTTKCIYDDVYMSKLFDTGIICARRWRLSGAISPTTITYKYHNTVFCCCYVMVDFTKSRWRHQMETFSALLAFCAGNSPVTRVFPSQRPVTRSYDVLFDSRLNKRLSNNLDAGDLKRNHSHYDIIVTISGLLQRQWVTHTILPVPMKRLRTIRKKWLIWGLSLYNDMVLPVKGSLLLR